MKNLKKTNNPLTCIIVIKCNYKINNNVNKMNSNKKINLMIYYKDKKSNNLLMRNNLNSPLSLLDFPGLLYKCICPVQS